MQDYATSRPHRRDRGGFGATHTTSTTTTSSTTGGNQGAVTDLGLDGQGLAALIAGGGTLREGDTGTAVMDLQARLGIAQSGSFDGTTKAALVQFQLAHSLGADGVVGKNTLAALDRVAAEIAAAPKGSEILFQVTTTGASSATASQDKLKGGVSASETMADTDEQRVLAMKDAFVQAGRDHGIPAALLAAIASRETRGGNSLKSDGYSRYDDNGFGVMQVDKRHHTPEGTAKSLTHIDQAASILADFRDQVADKHPDWTEAMILRGAVAAYNKGPGSVGSYSRIDKNTTGSDYSSDVWARARRYARLFGEPAVS